MTVNAAVERLTGLPLRDQAPVLLVGLGHSGIHWINGTFFLLLPFITEDLGLSYSEAGFLVSFFFACSAAANLGSGPLVDVVGRRILFQVMALVMGAAALFGFGGPGHYLVLLALMPLMGIANNLWHPAAISFLSRRFPENRGYSLSIHTLGANVGEAVAPLSAGGLLLWMSWRETAMVAALPVVAIAVLIAVALKSGTRNGERTAQPAIGIGEYLPGLLGLLKDKTVIGISLVAGFRAIMQNGMLVFLPLYLANDLEFGPLWIGVALTALQVGGMVGGPVAGAWSDRIGRKPILVASLAAATVLVLLLTVAGSGYFFIATVFFLGVFVFATRPVGHSWLMDETPAHLGGSATSLLFATQAGLSVLAPAIGGIVADLWGLPVVFFVLAAATVVSLVLAAALSERRKGGD